ncbi:sensor histidine kinase [Clostridium mediterraneense]|uniref:sensor histidine kinase n=1 Tax=Clostridium mediterraneense TaxID=1805472 RepID=UPI0013563809|nr:sensor histidine kinase [Clostridium mediterraneense]
MLFDTLKGSNNSIKAMVVLFMFLILVNDLIRDLIKNRIVKLISFSISLLTAASLFPFSSSFITIYLYATLVEAIFINKGFDKYYLLILNLITFNAYNFYNSLSEPNLISFLDKFSSTFIPYSATAIILLLVVARRKERKTIRELNSELIEQNTKLQEYSRKVEQLTLVNERNRVAQDLHDSLGHHLMALSMHLNILEKTIDKSPDKSKEILVKSQKIVSDSIAELRNTVYELKENKEDTSFLIAIKELTDNLSTLNTIEFKTEVTPEIEDYSPFIKDILYKTIKEALTNGVKHGKAKKFEILISIKDSNINLIIKNNGVSPDNIVKSNGLKGIEERFKLINGKVNFEILHPGFSINAIIPVRKEQTND